jgi:hypothetical protein
MLAIRLSTDLDSERQSAIEGAENRIRRVWEELAPELVEYAPTEASTKASAESSR